MIIIAGMEVLGRKSLERQQLCFLDFGLLDFLMMILCDGGMNYNCVLCEAQVDCLESS